MRPSKQRNSDRRPREYLREAEIEQLLSVTAGRDRALILLGFRHGLRSAELVSLRWSDLDLAEKRLHVRRVKGSIASVHPLSAREIELLSGLFRDSAYVFTSKRKTPLSTRTVRQIVAEAGKKAGISFPVSAHMLRHSAGYHLSTQGMDMRVLQGFLGHANVQHTARYIALDPRRYEKDYWKD